MINIYCDESCHLMHDNINVMVLGGISCPDSLKKELYKDIRDIKVKHGLDSRFEIKWTKVSKSKINFYEDLIDYFFQNDNLNFRAIVILNKDELNHSKFNNNSHDEWYYKMYYYLLEPIIDKDNEQRIFIDIKDTIGGPRINKLFEVLTNKLRDYNNKCLKRIDQINSDESEILQLADLMIGALGYYNRGLHLLDNANEGKVKIIDKLESEYNLNLRESTDRFQEKFNLFIWTPRKGDYYE